VRGTRWLVLAATAAALVGAGAAAPALLRRSDAFGVRRVEVVGTRFLAPHEALAWSGITAASSVFDDPETWRAALLRHVLVADAQVERRLPGTVVLRVVEAVPVALVAAPELRPVDAAGRLLPIDAAGADLDLPVLAVEPTIQDGAVADDVALGLIALLAAVQRADPDLAGRISTVEPARGGGVLVVLREPAGLEALLPADGGEPPLRELRAALADLTVRGELAAVRRVDVRFRDQAIISFTHSATS